MRALMLTACVVLLAAAADSSALAASGCNKGMLWPYVRQPGDCLTDDEIKAGQRGVYNGPINTNPDVSNVKVETPPTTSVTGESQGLISRIVGGGSRGTASSVPTSSVATATSGGSSGPSLNGPGFASPAPRNADDAPCSKGWLWPFVRHPGDCLTNTERGNGQAGVYRADQVVATASPAAGPGQVTQVSAPAPATTEAQKGTTETQTARAEPACRKGWLWPFVRKAGDCPTEAERRGR